MKNKKILLGIYIVMLSFITIIALGNVNKENTSALSPLGISTEENFQMVSEEFGKDFERFIQDKVNVKIYDEEDGTLIKFGEVNFKIKNNSEFINGIGEKITNIVESLTS